eukprot:3859131-Rhodomonas_salina.1
MPRLLTRGGAECRDAAWATQTCVVGWGVQVTSPLPAYARTVAYYGGAAVSPGVFGDGKHSGDVVAVARSRDGSMLAVGDATRRLLLTGVGAYPSSDHTLAQHAGRLYARVPRLSQHANLHTLAQYAGR